jgi:hypothetical protein
MSTKLDKLSKDELKALLKRLLEDDDTITPKKRGRPSKQVRESIRGNKFDQMEDLKDAFKADTEIDKLLWNGRKPSIRNRKSNLVTVECSECKTNFTTPPDVLTETIVCNKCISKKRHAN